MGGPKNEAMPWNNNTSPKAFVNLLRPNRSTRMTEVRPTQAPIVNPQTEAYIQNVQKSQQKALNMVPVDRDYKMQC